MKKTQMIKDMARKLNLTIIDIGTVGKKPVISYGVNYRSYTLMKRLGVK